MTAESEEGTTYTRLHITPLDPGLLPVVLSGTLLPRARNISYHEIATFPEKRYGFVELPAEDAIKLRKKLNGAVLKGQKILVEQAKPERQPEPMGDAAMAGDKLPKKKKDRKDKKEDKSKKRKREAEEIPGVELENGRKVKRGWTVAEDPKSYRDKDKRKKDKKDKKDKKERRELKSKYTEHPECLIKAVLPSKVVETGEVDEDGNKKRKKSKSKEVVVHEFAKTTKFPTFLKSTVSSSSSKGKGEIEFVDGKGWVDAEGNVVEAVKTRAPASQAKVTAVPAQDDVKPQSRGQETSMYIEGSPAGSDSREAGNESEEAGDDEAEPEAKEADSEPAGKDSASIREASPPPKPVSTPTSILKKDFARPTSSSSAKGLSIKIPPPPATPGGLTVHPLEALYKRPRPADGAPTQDAAPEPEPFSFFGSGDVEEDAETVTTQVPLTPFSRHDFETRGIRSAAPTPDTAHPSRMAKFWPHAGADNIDEEEEEDDEDDVADTAMRDGDAETDVQEAGQAAGEGAESSSDFQKWFWEHRGDLNRSWKKRRKTAAKEKRYRENRARAERAI
ncbi:hypothetical protein CONLIGDRAFT_685700 [Coniochaeta ligniaria NRRL 30616]|uniref:Uncharacterized protein n=1 Tax=Coniochaeta ligniaria NRRL 30616 TaxID=1408157 RepID=A0A1J7IUG6_9PEZI|nr:hypothetical protein CONLIGDRAFT_685700 [Coniochaeta ligniaria NRRL 30616]